MIVALAKKGGVVQVNFNCGFLEKSPAPERAMPRRKPIAAERLRTWWRTSITS